MSADCKLHGPSFLGLNSASSHEEGDIIFTGGSAVEAEDFIFAIKWQAYSKGKHKDNTWAAEYASIRFARKALRWYEKLDVETQNDWNLLKRAILDEYAEDQFPSSMVPTSVPMPPSSVPSMITPAASPIRTGRIRVESECSDTRGYIANTFHDTNWCTIAPNQSAAAIFDFDVSARTIKFQGTPDDYLIARAYRSDWDIRKGSNHWSAIVKNKGRSVAPKSSWSDDIQVDLWSMLNASKLVGRWPLKAGGFWELEGATFKPDKRIYLTPDSQEFVKHYGVDNYKLLTLYFETIA